MGSWSRKIIDHLLKFICALAFIQMPLFMHAYKDQLIGHVSELKWQIYSMRDSALRSGKNVDQYIQKFIEDKDVDFSEQGKMMKIIQKRFNKLSTALTKLEKATLITKPWIFIFYLDWDIFRSTAHTFNLGIPLTFEGLLYGLLGMGIGFILYRILEIFVIKLWHKIRHKPDLSLTEVESK